MSNKKILLHMLLMETPPEDYIIDHIDHDGLNNRKNNLRFACRKLNAQNKKKKEGTSSKYYGVSLSKWGWRAQYSRNSLGYFKEEIHAAYAYDIYIKEVYNNQGKINNIDKPDNFIPYNKKKIVGNPRGVVKSFNKFKVQYWDKEKKTYISLGQYETSDEASKIYESFRKKKEDNEKKLWYSQEIAKNSDGIAIIPVNNKGAIVYSLVDDVVWHDLMKTKWYVDDSGYVANSKSRLHQQILKNNDKNKIIDHVYNRFDNRLTSLRINSSGGNNHHRPAYSKSGFKGVKLVDNIKYQAQIAYEKKTYYLGRYDSIYVAAYAYNCAAKQFYETCASLNILDDNEFTDLVWDQEKLRLKNI